MKKGYRLQDIPRTRIATFDIFDVGLRKHHVSAILEFDVTESRSKLRDLRRNGTPVSFNAWIIKVIGKSLKAQPEAAAFLHTKKKLIIFEDINVSFLVEKVISGSRVPIPLVISKVNEKTAFEISQEIEKAKSQTLNSDDIQLDKKPDSYQRLYYMLPGFLRRLFWIILLKKTKAAFRIMGNVAVTSVGMMGKINGWFIHKSVHPLSFGIGSIIKKPAVIGNEIRIREILNMTILIDHDVIDGAPMVRFLDDLTKQIESGNEINCTNA